MRRPVLGVPPRFQRNLPKTRSNPACQLPCPRSRLGKQVHPPLLLSPNQQSVSNFPFVCSTLLFVDLVAMFEVIDIEADIEGDTACYKDDERCEEKSTRRRYVCPKEGCDRPFEK